MATAPVLIHPALLAGAPDECDVPDPGRAAGGTSAAHQAPPVVGRDPMSTVGPSLDRRREYRCECGHRLWVFGGGRHRVYFEPVETRSDAPARLDEPVMDRACPACGRGLPGKNPPQQPPVDGTSTSRVARNRP